MTKKKEVTLFEITVEDRESKLQDLSDKRKKKFILGKKTDELKEQIDKFIDDFNDGPKNRLRIATGIISEYTMSDFRICKVDSTLKNRLNIKAHTDIIELNEIVIALNESTEEDMMIIEAYKEKRNVSFKEAVKKVKIGKYKVFNYQNELNPIADVALAKKQMNSKDDPYELDLYTEDLKRTGDFLIIENKKIVIEFI